MRSRVLFVLSKYDSTPEKGYQSDEEAESHLRRVLNRMQAENRAMADRLEENEEVKRDEDGVLIWTSCGEPVARNMA
jgi:DNA-binding transcriptional MocR family regulator